MAQLPKVGFVRGHDETKKWEWQRSVQRVQAWEGGRSLHAKLGMQFDSFQMEVARQHGREGGCCGDSESVEDQEMLLSCARR